MFFRFVLVKPQAMKSFTYYVDENHTGVERIFIDKSTEKDEKVSAKFRMIEFQERDNNKYVCCIPSLKIIAQSETKAKAMADLRKSLDNFFSSLLKLPEDKIHSELLTMGWENHQIFKKNYSHLYVDEYGVLNNFNVNMGEVTTEVLELVS